MGESVQQALTVIAKANAAGHRVVLTLGAAFGCPFEGRVDPGVVLSIAEEFLGGGVSLLVFADTIGVATPSPVRHLVERGCRLGVPVGVHLHDTRNAGYANAISAIEAGAGTLDASIGGIGGCPFAPNATGNIATEDLVNLLEAEGLPTQVDLDALIRPRPGSRRFLATSFLARSTALPFPACLAVLGVHHAACTIDVQGASLQGGSVPATAAL